MSLGNRKGGQVREKLVSMALEQESILVVSGSQ